MKTTDLMVNNWVEVINSDHLKYVQIDGILGNSIFTKEGEYESEEIDISNINPIPLTPEILEKNGFKIMHGFHYSETHPTYGWVDQEGEKYISVEVTFYNKPIGGIKHLVKLNRDSIKGSGVDSIHSCDIDYVHELQHALRLCGIEKEIVL